MKGSVWLSLNCTYVCISLLYLQTFYLLEANYFIGFSVKVYKALNENVPSRIFMSVFATMELFE